MKCSYCNNEMIFEAGNEFVEYYICPSCLVLLRKHIELSQTKIWYKEVDSDC